MIKKFVLALIIIFLFNFNYSYAEKIKKFEITGNDRISDETIILFSEYNINDDISQSNLNEIIKNLYKTYFFQNIDIDFTNNILSIKVSENPLIQSVTFTGIKRTSLTDQIKNIILQKEKSSFVENKIKEDQNRILNSLRVSGYYFSDVSVNIKKNDNNTVDIVYQIDLGKKALIKKIKFIGNKIYKDNKLRKVIVSEEDKFWKFISSKKNVDLKRFELDKSLLENFYKNKGYYNVKINSSFAQIINNEYFEVIFNVDAGEKYYFNKLVLNLPIDYDKNDFINLENLIKNLENKPYSLKNIEYILDEIDEIALNNNYQFVNASYDEKIIKKNKINLSINLKDAEKYYIEKINITGNNITSENVIRNQLLADEGDAFNELLVNKSYNNIRSLRLFQNVKSSVETSDKKMSKIINIDVEEKATGEIFAGAGTGTSGSSLSFGISENNYLGEGIRLGTDLTISDKSITGTFFMNQPNYKNSNRSFNRGFERKEEDNLSTFGYELKKTGFSFGTSYEQYKNVLFSPTFEANYEQLTTTSKATAAKKKQEGNYLDTILDYSISLNKLNQNFNPTDGFLFTFSQELPIYSEDYTLINRVNYSKYFETDNNNVYSFSIFTATANSLSNDDARITKRIFIPQRKLRGFEPGKIGPKDQGEYVGGNYGAALNFASTLPGLFANLQDLDFSLFLDAANVWAVDYSSSVDDNSKIRSSTGIALDWFTPIGPLSLSYALPLTKASTDTIEKLRFNIGTTF
tara:strand:- start:1522 stop:3765 length:2244 start_codon:yes stop_codon:yes gene_type:complete